MIEIQKLQIGDVISYEVKNKENGKKSFVPHDENPQSLWTVVHLAVSAYHKKKHYRAMQKIANMELDSHLQESIVIVALEIVQIEAQQRSAEQPQQP